MVALDDKRWSELDHAYGKATDIPRLLRDLADFPPHDSPASEPYVSLWSSLCHQGDVYTASYAAVPHVVQMIAGAPRRAHWSALLLVTSIEIARANGNGPPMPDELLGAYAAALQRLPQVLAATAEREWDESFVRTAAATLAVARGQPALAEAILDLEPDVVSEFADWMSER